MISMKKIKIFLAVSMAAATMVLGGQMASAGPERAIPAQTGASSGGSLQSAVAHLRKLSKVQLKAKHNKAGSKIQKPGDFAGRPPEDRPCAGQVNCQRKGR
jgi:hypothetical protein